MFSLGTGEERWVKRSEGEERGGKRAEEEGEGVKKSEEQEPRCVYNVIITYCVVCVGVCV